MITGMEIKPVDENIRSLLTSGFYRIPRFQRPYSWSESNVDDFWTDAIVSPEEACFIGSFVVYRAKHRSDLFLVVDGQQRLTTITLLLAAIRNELHDLGFDPLAKGIHRLIEHRDINDEMQYVLQSETPYPYFQEYIQKYGVSSPPPTSGVEENSLRAAYAYLHKCVADALASIEKDTTIPHDTKHDRQKEKLIQIRDRLLRLQLILIALDNEDDAYLIFETLNTRGQDLTISDLVKGLLTRLLKPTNVGVDFAKDNWEAIRKRLEDGDLDINRFLHHFWLSRHPYIPEKKLFKKLKETVRKDNAKAFLLDLVTDSVFYVSIVDGGASWKKPEFPVHRSLQALSLFKVVQPVPFLLSLIRDYRGGGLSLKALIRVLHSLENFHVQFTAVTSQRTGGGTAQMYASAARSILEAQDTNTKGIVIRDFTDKLRDRQPSYDEFEAAFTEIRLPVGLSRQRPLVRYLLRRFDEHLRGDKAAPIDYEKMTIEHIAPRAEPRNVKADSVGMLGNLILVPEKLNNALGTRPIGEKLTMLREEQVPIDEALEASTSWMDADIVYRTRAMAESLYKKVLQI